MLRAHRLRAVRLCLLIVTTLLLSATAVALAAGARPSRAAASDRAHAASSRMSKRPTKCVTVARRGHGGRRRKAVKSCAGGKSRASARKPSASRRGASSRRGSSVASGASAVEISEPAAPEGGVSEEPQGGSGSDVLTSPIEPTGPEEPTKPVERSKPEEPTKPVEPPKSEEPTTPVEPMAPFRFFSPTSFWNEPLPADAPLDPSSGVVVGALVGEIATEEEAKNGPAINTTSWSVPIYTVPADQPAVKVTLENASWAPALQLAWDAVPLPADAQVAAGADKHLVVWQPSIGRLWEFWHLEDASSGWRAAWGGAMDDASSASGAYGPEDWSGAGTGWGASGSSLSIAGGLITLEDLERGQINHALAMAIPNVRAGVYASPAERTDGKASSPLSLPEGAHLRLDPSLDLAALHLPHLTLMMAEAAQRYGIVIRDFASNVAFYAQDPIPTGTEPYGGSHGYFEGKSSEQLLASFPWSHLQLLEMELHSTS
jgi:hypothetical protein